MHEDDHDHDHDHEHEKWHYLDRDKAEGEGREILTDQMERIKKFSYAGLTALMGAVNAENYDCTGKSGTQYEVTVESSWQDKEKGNLVIHIAVFEKEWLSFLPVSGGFVMAPDGSIADEWMEG